MKGNLKKYLTLIVLGASGGAIYTLPYIKYVFYDAITNVLGISNAQSGFLLSMYAIGCVILYIPGGILSDKVSPKKAVIFSLLGTCVCGLLFAFTMNYVVGLLVWLLFAFGTGFVFWSAILKAVRMIGTDEEQGRMYGVYYAANGTASAVINALALRVYGGFSNGRTGLFWALILMCASIAICAILLKFLLNEDGRKVEQTAEEDKFHFSDLKSVLTNPAVWLISIVFFCIYGVYSCTSYFTPYLTNVIGFSETTAGYLQIIRSYVVMLIAAPIGGLLVDKVFRSTLKWFSAGAFVLGISILLVILTGTGANGWLIAILTLIPGLFSMCLYGVMFSAMHEINIPVKAAGTAIGIASIIGYLPDMFLQTFFGQILDTNGNAGYMTIFAILTAFCFIVTVISIGLYRAYHKRAKAAAAMAK